jgi:hypothetical protein
VPQHSSVRFGFDHDSWVPGADLLEANLLIFLRLGQSLWGKLTGTVILSSYR